MQTKWIWIDKKGEDLYTEFIGDFLMNDTGRYVLKLACDGIYAVYVNQELAMFGQSSDYPDNKLYDKKVIGSYCKAGEYNQIRILVWNMGIDTQNYIRSNPALWFEITRNGEKVLVSDESILSRQDIRYQNGYCKPLTPQLGYSYHFDNSIENNLPFKKSVVVKTYRQPKYRNMPTMSLRKYQLGKIISQDVNTVLVDLERETVGFLKVALRSVRKQKIIVCWAEHLVAGSVQRYIGNRDFSLEITLKEGENVFFHPLRRMAGRYFEIHFEFPIELLSVGLQPIMRNVRKKKTAFENEELQKIYDISVDTLRLCMHEHYEDCPWREQCMYLMDARNQMLCGYYAFEGYNFQKQNLLFFGQGQREDGLFSINFPGGIDIPIPSFSLIYSTIVYEYITHTGDKSVLNKIRPIMQKMLSAFGDRIEGNGLIPNFPYPYWNFYEWAKDSDFEGEIARTKEQPYKKEYHLILNCMYVYACDIYEKLYGEKIDTTKTKAGIKEIFYDKEKGLYKLNDKKDSYSQLGNSLVILVGMGDEELAERLLSDKTVIPVTLSMASFLYDALLAVNYNYKDWILQDIRKKYGYMLEQEATTFWETEKGWRDFDGAGSLCHGWSAMPIYYLRKLAVCYDKLEN